MPEFLGQEFGNLLIPDNYMPFNFAQSFAAGGAGVEVDIATFTTENRLLRIFAYTLIGTNHPNNRLRIIAPGSGDYADFMPYALSIYWDTPIYLMIPPPSNVNVRYQGGAAAPAQNYIRLSGVYL